MNKIENHVTSPELSKQLRDKGFRKDSCFYWYEDEGIWKLTEIFDETLDDIPAYLLSELLEYLQKQYPIGKLTLYKPENLLSNNLWQYGSDMNLPCTYFEDKNMCNAVAKTILWLINNKYIKPDTERE